MAEESECDGLSSKLDLLHISKNQVMPAISAAEYYYSFDMNQLENLAEIDKIALAPVKRKRDKPKKQKADERKIAKVQALEAKLSSLSITVQNEKFQQSPKASSNKSLKELNDHTKPDGVLKDKISDLKLPKMKKKDKKKRDEILMLNQQIQEKINNRIKPKLKSILGEKPQNGIIEKRQTTSESAQSTVSVPKPRAKSTNQDRIPAIPKTKIMIDSKEEVELQRYSFEQLYSLQNFGTYEVIPTLLKLNICKTNLETLDVFLMLLLSMPQNEQSEAIFRKAEERNLIRRNASSSFEFISPDSIAASKAEIQTKEVQKQKKSLDHFVHMRRLATSDEELNILIYQHEFLCLFENELKNQEVSKLPHAEMVQYLLDNGHGYILEGEIRINQRNCQEAYVTHKKGLKDVCINKLMLRKYAFQGDYVRVIVKKDSVDESNVNSQSNESSLEEETRSFGCVLDILEQRHSRRVLGSFAALANIDKHRKHLMINVRDPKVPNVRVNIRKGLPTDIELSDKLLLTVEITNWLVEQPQGKVVSIIGNKGQLKTENLAILQQNNLYPVPFEENIINQLPNEPFDIPLTEFEYREDLRKKCIFSIDPESARDLDDALSCEVLDNGNLEIGVHISDVSYFVKENSDLDNIVKEKATTIYLVDTVYHMLPEKLCFLCSLLPGSDKMAYSVFFEMDPETAEIYNTRYTRSIVNSCAKLSYDHAQQVIEQDDQNWTNLTDFPEIFNGFTVAQVADVIVKLQKLAVILRASRKASGALKIDQPKLLFRFAKDDSRMEAPVDFTQYCTKDSNRLIEEFMLLANIYVAKYIYEKFPDISLLRQHDPPNENALKKLAKVLNKHKHQIDASSSSALSKSMENLIASAKYPDAMCTVINHMVSKTMTRARYFCSHMAENPDTFWHYALSTPIYTHFTSPIRRYADILVHRALNAALNYEQVPSRSTDELQSLANICNAQKYNSKLAGDDSSNLYFMHFIKSLKSNAMLAGVLGIYEYNLEIVLINTGHLVKVYYKNLQQNDDVIIKAFFENSPPLVKFSQPKLQTSMTVEFGGEVLVQVEIVNDKLCVNKIFYNQKAEA